MRHNSKQLAAAMILGAASLVAWPAESSAAFIDFEDLSDLEKSVYDPHYGQTERFIKEAGEHLKEGGRLLIGFSTTLGRINFLEQFAKDAGFKLQRIYEAESEEVYPVKFEIFEAVPL